MLPLLVHQFYSLYSIGYFSDLIPEETDIHHFVLHLGLYWYVVYHLAIEHFASNDKKTEENESEVLSFLIA
jgi:hypothetical protein